VNTGGKKLFSERLYLAFQRNYGHQRKNSPVSTTFSARKVPGTMAARKHLQLYAEKSAMAEEGTEIEIWGDGKQTRSFLYIDECLEGIRRLMDSDWTGPVNIGSEEMVTINKLAEMIMGIAGKELDIRHVPGPLGVRGRNSDNELIFSKLGWKPPETSC
jgi:nucleoside-diphosphate-sugar epimerase